jgi:hypothetical protein
MVRAATGVTVLRTLEKTGDDRKRKESKRGQLEWDLCGTVCSKRGCAEVRTVIVIVIVIVIGGLKV